MPQHPEGKNPTTPSERTPAASRLPPVPAKPEPERYAQQVLNTFLVHHELTRSHRSGSAEEVSAEQLRVWSETYAAQRIHLVDLIVAGLRSGTVLF